MEKMVAQSSGVTVIVSSGGAAKSALAASQRAAGQLAELA
jgi:hypothetical protein